MQVSSINRELQVLRRMFYLTQEWGKVEKALPKVRMLPGERHRERVLTAEEETHYLGAARPLLRDVTTVLLDCGLRPLWKNASACGGRTLGTAVWRCNTARRKQPVGESQPHSEWPQSWKCGRA